MTERYDLVDSYQDDEWGLIDVYKHSGDGHLREQVVAEDEWLDKLEEPDETETDGEEDDSE